MDEAFAHEKLTTILAMYKADSFEDAMDKAEQLLNNAGGLGHTSSLWIDNVNERENRRTGKENNLVSDMHLAYMTVGYNCPFVGERLKNADLRRKYGVNVVAIIRNSVRYPIPTGKMRIFPGDQIGVIGTDDQIQTLLPLLEPKAKNTEAESSADVEFTHFELTENSPLIGKKLGDTSLREDYKSLLVAVERGAENFISVTPDLEFAQGDIIWIVGDKELMKKLK